MERLKYQKAAAEVELFDDRMIFTKKSWGDDKPGWGFGDKNHDHGGPPGITGDHPNGKW